MKTIVASLFAMFLLISCSDKENPRGEPENNTFVKSTQTLGNTRTFGLAIADIDRDNDKDIMIANYIGNSKLWLNNGNGNFTMSNQDFAAFETHDVGIADLNGDRFQDIIFLCHANNNKIYFNNGDQSFSESDQNIGSSADAAQYVHLGDVDNDDDIDFIIYNFNSANRLWINDGNGSFTMADVELGDSNTKGFELADFNGDNYLDLFVNMRALPNQIWLNDKTGSFVNDGYTFGFGGENFDCFDFEGDGDLDLFLTDNGGVTVWLNQNNIGTFVLGKRIEEEAIDCLATDADLDGDCDILTVHLNLGNKLWINSDDGNFQSQGTMFGIKRALCIESDDLDNDGDIDIILGQLEGTGGNSIYLNQSSTN